MPATTRTQRDFLMKLSEYLDRAIKQCERRIRSLDLQQKTDIGYVNSADADPTDRDYYRCQVELQAAERAYLSTKLIILQKWTAIAVSSDFVPLVPPGEAQ